MTSETGFDPKLFDRFPTAEARPQSEVDELERIWAPPRGWRMLTIVNNNYVGLWYVATAFLFFLLAGVLALAIRAQLSLPLLGILPQETYNQFFTMHGTVMMFLFAVPVMEAIGVMLLPQMLAARDLPFPRLSAYAFWAYFVRGLSFFRVDLRRACAQRRLVHVSAADHTIIALDQRRFLAARHRLHRDQRHRRRDRVLVGILKTRAPA